MQTKDMLDKQKKFMKGTGGGPPAVPYTAMEENVIAVLGDSAEPSQNEYDDEGEYVEMFPLHDATILDVPMVLEESVAPDNSPNEDETFSSTPRATKKKRCHAANDMEEMMEVHQRQLHLLQLQEQKAKLEIKKAKLDVYLSEQEILKKGHKLPEWHQ